MANEFKTSFIPKKTEERRRKSRGQGLLSLIGTVIFVLALVGAGGVFLYGKLLENGIERKKESLERAREAFEPGLIEELARLDTRLTRAEELLAKHTAPSYFFDLLETLTVKDLRFQDFSYSVTPGGDISIEMGGEARTFNAVAVQSDIFGKNQSIRDTLFGDLNLNQIGNVEFSFASTLDPSFINYQAVANTSLDVETNPALPQNPTSTSTATSTDGTAPTGGTGTTSTSTNSTQ